MGDTKKFEKKKIGLSKADRKFLRSALGRLETLTGAAQAASNAHEETMAVRERELAETIGSEGYVALRLGLAREGRKTLRASLKGLNRLTETVMPVAESALMGALSAEQNRAKARLIEAEASLLNAQTREKEAAIKEQNARTEAIKASKIGLA